MNEKMKDGKNQSGSGRIETISLPSRRFTVASPSGSISMGSGFPLALIAGPCVIDSRDLLHEAAKEIANISQRFAIPTIFKSSYEKDNRGTEKNWRGPLAEEGLKLLAEIRQEYGLPVLTDVHRTEDVPLVAEYVDVLQVPAYMCQQTSLVLACGQTGKPVNIKKGQFLAPETMAGVVSKINSTGNKNVLLTERGACFGYNRLVADMRSIPIMQQIGVPVCFDAPHVLRMYGVSSADPAGGEPRFIPHLALAAVAAGADCLFVESHPDPMSAKCDAASQLDLKNLPGLIKLAQSIRAAIGSPENVGLMTPP